MDRHGHIHGPYIDVPCDHGSRPRNAKRHAAEDFDVVFTDLAMPEMDGWETARAIRQQKPDLPVVLVTGYGATAQPPSGERDLVAAIIGKPFDFEQVSAILAKVCNDSVVSIEEPVLAAQ